MPIRPARAQGILPPVENAWWRVTALAGVFHPPADRQLWAGLHDPSLEPECADVVLIGLPYDGAVSYRRGAGEAPDRIRSISYHIPPTTERGEPLEGIRLVDLGNVAPEGPGQAEYFARVRSAAQNLFGRTFPVFVGGDHSVTIPVLQALASSLPGPLGVVHVDAHLDLCPELDGNPLSHGCTARRGLELPGISLERMAFVGIRSFEPEELDFLAHNDAFLVHAADFPRLGPAAVAELVRARLAGARHVYLTVDIDVLDPAFAPGTGTPKPGGITTRELLDLVGCLWELPLAGMDVVEVAPPWDHADITAFAAQRVIVEVMGHVLRRRRGSR